MLHKKKKRSNMVFYMYKGGLNDLHRNKKFGEP